MKYAEFKAVCPYEIGDKIKVIQEEREEVHTITDIVCMHYLKTGAVQFLFELDNSGKLVSIAPDGRGLQAINPAVERVKNQNRRFAR